MKLVSFRVQNFRSVTDSGNVVVSKLTSLVGRNEAGKSNLLLALRTLNPPGGAPDLSPIKNFPRQRRLSECTDDTPVVSTIWELTADEQAALIAMFPRAAGVTHVNIGRRYKAATKTVGFEELKPLTFSADEVASRLRKLTPVAEVEIEKLDAPAQTVAQAALQSLVTALSASKQGIAWATSSGPALAAFRKALAVAAATLPDREDGLLAELEDLAAQITADEPAHIEARKWAVSLLPVFVYVDDYPELTGHQNIAEYLVRKATPAQLTDADRNFEKMCKVADLDPQQLHTLHASQDHETRNQLANRASAIVTGELRRLWKDRQLKVRFSPDANHLDTFISDPNSVYDVEVNLNERSRGLKWSSPSISLSQLIRKAAARRMQFYFWMNLGFTFMPSPKKTCSTISQAISKTRSSTQLTRRSWFQQATWMLSAPSTSARTPARRFRMILLEIQEHCSPFRQHLAIHCRKAYLLARIT